MKSFNRLGVVVLALIALSPARSVQARSDSAVQAFNEGVKQYNAGRFADALPLFNKAIQREADFPEAFYARAVCKRNTEDFEGALSDLNQTLQLKPDDLDAYALRGSIWYEREQWDSALQDFDYVLKRRPNDAQALLGRGVIALRQQHLKSARRDFRRFLKVRPDDPVAARLRKFLASTDEEDTSTAEAAASPEQQSTGAKPMSPSAEQLAKELFSGSHQVSDDYQRKVMRGERADTVGDIQSNSVEIVDPGN